MGVRGKSELQHVKDSKKKKFKKTMIRLVFFPIVFVPSLLMFIPSSSSLLLYTRIQSSLRYFRRSVCMLHLRRDKQTRRFSFPRGTKCCLSTGATQGLTHWLLASMQSYFLSILHPVKPAPVVIRNGDASDNPNGRWPLGRNRQ
jgi:hypothetical protein